MIDSQATEGLAALAGQGLAMLTPALWQNELAAGKLVQPFGVVAFKDESYWLTYRPEQRLIRKIALFRQWVLETFR